MAGPVCFLNPGPRASGRLWQLSWLDGPDGEGVDALKSVPDPSGVLLRVDLKNGDKITNLTFGTQQNILLSTQAGHIFLLDLTKNRYRRVGSLGKVTCIALDGKEGVNALVGLEGGKVVVLDTVTGAVRGRLIHPGEVEWLGFSDGGKLAVGMGKRGATVWSLQKNVSINRLKISDEGSDLGCVRLLRGAGEFKYRIVSGSVDGKVAIWGARATRGDQQLQVLRQFQEECQCDAIEVSGESIFIGCSSGEVKQYRLESGLLQSSTPFPPQVRLTGLSFINNVLVLHSVDGLVFVKLSSGAILGQIANCGRPEFSSCGRLMAGLRDGQMLLYKMDKFLPRVESISKPPVGEKVCSRKEINSRTSTSEKNCDEPVKVVNVLSENAVNINRGASKDVNPPNKVLKVSSDESQLILDNFTREKLLPILKSISRGFPSRHRELIWCQLLAVPRNKKAFASLQRLGPHPSLSPESSAILSAILHWSPSLSLLPYIPPFLTPLINQFSSHPRAGFEVCVSILLNYCLDWWSHAPGPPPTAKEAWQLLEEEDFVLKTHLQEIGCDVRNCVWPILQTGWSTLLSVEAWSTVWDHLLVASPAFLPSCLAATIITIRPLLMNCTSSRQVSRLLSSQQTLDVPHLLQTAYALQEEHPNSAMAYQGLAEGCYPRPIVLENEKEIIAGEKAAGSKIYVETKISKHESKKIRDALSITPPPIPRIKYNVQKAREKKTDEEFDQHQQTDQCEMKLPNFDKMVSRPGFSGGEDSTINPMRPLQPLYPSNSTRDGSREFLEKIHQNPNGVDEAILLLDKAKFIRGLLSTK